MRPLRYSSRAGFQGRSKWIRLWHRAWRLMPSRAADQDAQRIVRRIGIEAPLQFLPPIKRCGARERGDTFVGAEVVQRVFRHGKRAQTQC